MSRAHALWQGEAKPLGQQRKRDDAEHFPDEQAQHNDDAHRAEAVEADAGVGPRKEEHAEVDREPEVVVEEVHFQMILKEMMEQMVLAVEVVEQEMLVVVVNLVEMVEMV